ncbi:MAG TPA: hypothetical protein PK453_04245 [Leptospiraceae bacterium]|nr:hypothetical protein [Leptospiraceae bacterium]
MTIDAGGQTRKKTVLHSAPNASSKSLSCTLWDQNGKKEFEGKSLKSGVYLRVIAKMKENQDRENAWYYVDASAAHENSCGPGWVQEEFLSIAHGGG